MIVTLFRYVCAQISSPYACNYVVRTHGKKISELKKPKWMGKEENQWKIQHINKMCGEQLFQPKRPGQNVLSEKRIDELSHKLYLETKDIRDYISHVQTYHEICKNYVVFISENHPIFY